MNKICVFIVLAALGTASSALADKKIFKASASYKKYESLGSSNRFYDLEILGVQRAAEINAINACMGSGASDCVILNATTTKDCNIREGSGFVYCNASAVARGTIDP